MTIAPADVPRELLDTFDGKVIAIEPRQGDDWPASLDQVEEGQLWVSTHLSACIDTSGDLASDFTSVDQVGGRNLARHYRQLDENWYVWLYLSMRRAQVRVGPKVWERLRGRFNAIYAVCRRWWGSERVQWLHKRSGMHLDHRYQPPRDRRVQR